MNVKLVKSLREKVKVRVLPQLVEIAKKSSGDALAGSKGKQLLQKVRSLRPSCAGRTKLIRCVQTVFEELVRLVDPGESAPPAFDVRSSRVCVSSS